jgi:hypothetical protein
MPGENGQQNDGGENQERLSDFLLCLHRAPREPTPRKGARNGPGCRSLKT